MKKIFSFTMVAALLAVLLAGCDGGSAGKSEESSGQPWQESTVAADSKETESGETAAVPADAPEDNSVLFTFTRDNYPRLDGSTSMVPLGKAIASVLLGESVESVSDITEFHKTTQSFRNLKDGLADILVVGEPQAAVFDEMKKAGFEYDLEEIATDALIFVVNADNPVDNLTTEQIRDIYSGKITNWKQVGGRDARIKAFQRNEGAGSQALMLKHIMKDTPMQEPVTGFVATEMGELMEAVKSYDNSADAIGYSVYYYANDMKMADGLKIISVDGVEPCAETIRSGEYPHLNACYCVIPKTAGAAMPNRILYKWLMSDDGQRLVESMGYVAKSETKPQDASVGAVPGKADLSLLDNNIKVTVDYSYTTPFDLPEPVYTRLKDERMPELKARNDYGAIYPYTGTLLYSDNGEGDYYRSGSFKGMFDSSGRLITDPVYAEINVMTYWDRLDGTEKKMPFYQLLKVDEDEVRYDEYGFADNSANHYSFASMDGKFVSGEYGYIKGSGGYVICGSGYDSETIDVYDEKGRIVLTEKEIFGENPWLKDWTKEASLTQLEYGEGFYSIDNYEEAYFLDEKGKVVLGPYEMVYPYSGGQAVVRKPGYEAGFSVIDTQGNTVIEGGIRELTVLSNGNYAAVTKDGISIYDRTGRKLASRPGASISRTVYGFVAEGEDEGSNYFCDFEGNVLFEDAERVYSYSRSPIIYINGEDASADNGGNAEGTSCTLTNVITGKTVLTEGYREAYPFYTLEGEADIPYIRVTNYNDDGTEDTALYDYTLKAVYKGCCYINSLEDKITGDSHICINHSQTYATRGNYDVYDAQMRKTAHFENYPEVYNGIFMTEDDWSFTASDKGGKVIFRYSLVNSLGD